MGKVTGRIERLVAAASAAFTRAAAAGGASAGGAAGLDACACGDAGRGLAWTRMPTVMLVAAALAAALAAGLTVTACSPAGAPAGAPVSQGGPAAAAPAGQAQAGQSGEDPGCQAIVSQVSSISSQLSATSGDYSAQVPVLQTWYNDLQSAQQEAQSGLVAGALGDTASGVENIIVDEQNLMDDPSVGFSQLDSDDSNYQSDVSDLETACGFSS